MPQSRSVLGLFVFLFSLLFLSGCEGHIDSTAPLPSPNLAIHLPDLSPDVADDGPTVWRTAADLPCFDCDGDDSDGGEDGEMTDADYAAMLIAYIVDATSYAILTGTEAGAGGETIFMGSNGSMTTKMDLYFQDRLIAGKQDNDTYRATIGDWLSAGLGYCSTYGQLVNGIVVTCPHRMSTEINPRIALGADCGHKVRVGSSHQAEMLLKSRLWGADSRRSTAQLSQRPCEQPPVGGGGGGGGSCQVFTCVTYFYVDTGEVISVTCWCSQGM